MNRKIILYIAISLDGFIARKNGDIDWLTKYQNEKEDYGFENFYENVDIVIVGGKTYRQVKEAYNKKEVYVFSRKSPKQKIGNINFVKGDVKKLIDKIKLKDGKNIWLVGGADLTNQFRKDNLIDEYIITFIPTLLGEGISLFSGKNYENNLKLLGVKNYSNGLVQMHYSKLKIK